MEAITQAGTCVGVLTKEGVVLGAQKRVVSKLLETKGQTYVLPQKDILSDLIYVIISTNKRFEMRVRQ